MPRIETHSASPAGGELVVVRHAPFNAESALPHLGDAITPASRFYVRSNFPVPALAAETHRISVGGRVRQRLDFDVDDLRALGLRTVTATMECAGNNRLSLAPLPSGEPWSAGAVSTAIWAGVPLRAVLDRAGVLPDTVEILVQGVDHGTPKDAPGEIPFARSLPLAKALEEDTLLALEMNGVPLSPDHGAPVRLVVPDWYGMCSVKWVGRVDAIAEPFGGYYQRSRYIYDYGDGRQPEPVTTMRVKSLIVTPAESAEVPAGRCLIRGQAWSGEGEIVRVEVAIDGGETWQDARLVDAPVAHAWRAWEYEWQVAEPGRHVLRSRATDSAGNRQPDATSWNKYGYGNNAARPVAVNVVP
jgi:DMSO/TMAO reductase YedYZ molybdopterin-dependent catalytic subunit